MKTHNGINYKYIFYGTKGFIRYLEEDEYKWWDKFERKVAIRIFIDGEEYAEGELKGSIMNEITYSKGGDKTADELPIDLPCIDSDIVNQEPIVQRLDALTRSGRTDIYGGDKMVRHWEDRSSNETFDESINKSWWNPLRVKVSDLIKLKQLRKVYDDFNNSLYSDHSNWISVKQHDYTPKHDTYEWELDNKLLLCIEDGTLVEQQDYDAMRKLVDHDYQTFEERNI